MGWTNVAEVLDRSEENPIMMNLYNGLLKGKVHELLHVEYGKEN